MDNFHFLRPEWFFVLVPLFVIKKRTPFAKFHIQQGMNLFLFFVATWVLTLILAAIPVIGWILVPVVALVQIVFAVLALIALFNAVQGGMWKIPIIHSLNWFDINNLK